MSRKIRVNWGSESKQQSEKSARQPIFKIFKSLFKKNDVMFQIKWLAAFLCCAMNIKCSMIIGNGKFLQAEICKPKLDYWVTEIKKHQFLFPGLVPETKSPHDLSNWPELSSPYTESSDENGVETTTHVHEPFFEENSTQINVTTQLGSDVFLSCRVNDLREKMVSEAMVSQTEPKLRLTFMFVWFSVWKWEKFSTCLEHLKAYLTFQTHSLAVRKLSLTKFRSKRLLNSVLTIQKRRSRIWGKYLSYLSTQLLRCERSTKLHNLLPSILLREPRTCLQFDSCVVYSQLAIEEKTHLWK